MCVCVRKQDLTGPWFQSRMGFDQLPITVLSNTSPLHAYKTILTKKWVFNFRVCRRLRALLQGQCRATTRHCRTWLGLAFTWSGKLLFSSHLRVNDIQFKNWVFFRAPAHSFWAKHSNVETAVLLVACFRTTTHSKWASLCEPTLY